MKVKITHTILYEDVPGFVEQALKKCRDSLVRASEFKFDMTDLQKTIQELRTAQALIEVTSNQLDDCLNIAKGYVGAQTEIESSELAQGETSEEVE